MILTLAELRARLSILGYGLSCNVTDSLGRRWAYRTSPIASGGGTSYFSSKTNVATYVEQVEQIRRNDDSLSRSEEAEYHLGGKPGTGRAGEEGR